MMVLIMSGIAVHTGKRTKRLARCVSHFYFNGFLFPL
jgi:hypothetical protein